MKLLMQTNPADTLESAEYIVEFLAEALTSRSYEEPISTDAQCGALLVFTALRSDLGELRQDLCKLGETTTNQI